MATVAVDFPGLVRFMSRLKGASSEAISRGVLSASNKARPIMERAVLNAPPASARGSVGAVNNRDYLRSWHARRETRNGNIGLLVYSAGVAYAGVIEHGRRVGASTPPPEALARWAQRKLGLPYKQAKRAGFAMSKAISKRGLQPRRVLTGQATQDALVDAFRTEVLFELVEAVKALR